MKPLRALLATVLATVASGCASYSPYNVDEATIEKHLVSRLEGFSQEMRAGGIPVTLKLNRANVAIGPEKREVVMIDFDGKAVLVAPLAPVDFSFRIEGKPEYDKEEQAIYIRNAKLLSSEFEAAGSTFNLGPLTGTLSDIGAQFLDNHPVYRLDTNSGGAKLFSLMNLEVSILPGRIALVPAGNEDEAQRPVR